MKELEAGWKQDICENFHEHFIRYFWVKIQRFDLKNATTLCPLETFSKSSTADRETERRFWAHCFPLKFGHFIETFHSLKYPIVEAFSQFQKEPGSTPVGESAELAKLEKPEHASSGVRKGQ